MKDEIVFDLGDVQSSPYINNTLWCDHTSLSIFRTCPRKYYYRIHRGLVTCGVSALPELCFGKHIHEALDALYLTKDPRAAVQTFVDAYAQYEFDDEKRSLSRGAEIVADYAREYAHWLGEAEVLEVEYRYNIPLTDYRPSGEFTFRGIIDKVVRVFGKVHILDHKTSSYINSPITQAFGISRQFLGYSYAIKQDAKYRDDFAYAWADMLLVHPKNNAFERIPVILENLDEWLEGTVHNLQMIDACRVANVWPQGDTTACSSYNRVCPYYFLCRAPAQTREEMIRTNFVVEPWDLDDRR